MNAALQPGGNALPALTGLRGLAALLVLGFHGWQFAGAPRGEIVPWHAPLAAGYLGVDLFFVLSAFLLSQPFLRWSRGDAPYPDLLRYARHRVRRVVPALWMQLLLLATIGLAAGAMPDRSALIATAFFLQTLFDLGTPFNPVYWSLPVEWWFYVALPLAMLPLRWIRGWLLLLVVCAAAWVFRLWLAEAFAAGRIDGVNGYGAIVTLRARADQFALGVAAAWLHLTVPRDSPWRTRASGAGALALVILLPIVAARGDLFNNADFPWLYFHYTLVALPLAAIVFGAAAALPGRHRVLAHPWLVAVGTVSYSLYLWHFPVLAATAATPVQAMLGPAPTALLGGAAALAAAWLSWRWFERPFLARN